MLSRNYANSNPQFPRFGGQWRAIRNESVITWRWGIYPEIEFVDFFLCPCCRRQKRWAGRVAVGPAYVCADCQNVSDERVVAREIALWQEVRGE